MGTNYYFKKVKCEKLLQLIKSNSFISDDLNDDDDLYYYIKKRFILFTHR